MTRLGVVAAAALGVAAVVAAEPAYAVWSATGSGSAGGAATVMPKGNTPSTSRTGSDVALRWTAVALPGGAAVSGYIVHRYNATTGAPATVGAGCSGVVTTTTCTETSVASGSWVYTDTPVQANWTGTESANSATVTVP